MKKQILSIILGATALISTTGTYAAEKNASGNLQADEITVKNAGEQSVNATDAVMKISAEGFIVNSQADGHAVTTAYDKKGKWVYTIEHYATDNLAKNIMDIVKEDYGNLFITSMEKIQQRNSATVFLVHAEDGTTMKTFRVANGEVDLVQGFVKG